VYALRQNSDLAKTKGKLYGSCQRLTKACRSQKFLKEVEANAVIEQILDDLVSPSQAVVSWLTELLRSDFSTEIDAGEEAAKAINMRISRLNKMDEMYTTISFLVKSLLSAIKKSILHFRKRLMS
jgi:hypothetical protein